MANPSFETAMKQLEQIVLELESGEPALEKALKKFEQGMQLVRHCTAKLDETEKRISLLTRDGNDDLVETDFVEDDERGD